MEEDLQLCTNCGKKVPSAYFFLHEVHCLRFRTICPECKEVILKKEMKDHQENGHKQVQCSLCLQSMQKYLLEAHEAECSERPIACEFCKLAIPLSHLEEHETGCGGQRVSSLNHGQPVLPAQLTGQKDTRVSRLRNSRKAPRKLSCPKCSQDISEAKFHSHQDECHRFTELLGSFDSCLLKRPEQPSPVLWEPGTSPSIQGREGCPSKKKEGRAFKVLLSSQAARYQPAQGKEEEEYNVLEGCSHCHILLPLPILKQHEEKCQRWASHINGRF
ncbi:LOW QUALITY PROTEIN: XIAP-associated factor 1 [Dromiciops gliroides]|uniref:LOW QUALITY PROTEIN: XIAP-associated factor 1 n=1 Tax=Dromiciops gliroides TaxID=33562 RepID=UPI001CC6D257|nr:LOW QUALITY PROTEIN: XIAP-associated factor 1 [Dromiciops gliroides]